MKNNLQLRFIQESDAEHALDIYKYYVENSIISFEYEAPGLQEYIQRIKTNTAKYPWLVCSDAHNIFGFAYGSTHRYRTAYQWSVESTIYLAPEFHSRGLGSILYKTLFSLLKLQGYFNVYAGVALPNVKSVSFHRAMGFEEIGTFKNIGYKHGNWHDTQWFQLVLQPPMVNPGNPKSVESLQKLDAFISVLSEANKQLKNKFKNQI